MIDMGHSLWLIPLEHYRDFQESSMRVLKSDSESVYTFVNIEFQRGKSIVEN